MGQGVDICLSYNTAHKKIKNNNNSNNNNNKNSQTKYRKTEREGRANKRSQYKVSCFIVLIVLK